MGIRDGDPDALEALVELRGGAVLAYCERACPPGVAAEAAAEAFARFRSTVVAVDRPTELDPETALLSATRHAAARRAPRPSPPPAGALGRLLGGKPSVDQVAMVPLLLAARADGVLEAADEERLNRLLDVSASARAVEERFRGAELAYRGTGHRPVPGPIAEQIVEAMADVPFAEEDVEEVAAVAAGAAASTAAPAAPATPLTANPSPQPAAWPTADAAASPVDLAAAPAPPAPGAPPAPEPSAPATEPGDAQTGPLPFAEEAPPPAASPDASEAAAAGVPPVDAAPPRVALGADDEPPPLPPEAVVPTADEVGAAGAGPPSAKGGGPATDARDDDATESPEAEIPTVSRHSDASLAAADQVAAAAADDDPAVTARVAPAGGVAGADDALGETVEWQVPAEELGAEGTLDDEIAAARLEQDPAQDVRTVGGDPAPRRGQTADAPRIVAEVAAQLPAAAAAAAAKAKRAATTAAGPTGRRAGADPAPPPGAEDAAGMGRSLPRLPADRPAIPGRSALAPAAAVIAVAAIGAMGAAGVFGGNDPSPPVDTGIVPPRAIVAVPEGEAAAIVDDLREAATQARRQRLSEAQKRALAAAEAARAQSATEATDDEEDQPDTPEAGQPGTGGGSTPQAPAQPQNDAPVPGTDAPAAPGDPTADGEVGGEGASTTP